MPIRFHSYGIPYERGEIGRIGAMKNPGVGLAVNKYSLVAGAG